MKATRTKKLSPKAALWEMCMAEEAAMPQAEKDRIDRETGGGQSREEKNRIYGNDFSPEGLHSQKYGAR